MYQQKTVSAILLAAGESRRFGGDKLTAPLGGRTVVEWAARALFSQGGDRSNMPSATLSAGDLTDGQITVVDLLVKGGLAPSKGEARRLIQQGGVEIDGTKVTDTAAQVSAQALEGEGITVKKGKKTFLKVTLG